MASTKWSSSLRSATSRVTSSHGWAVRLLPIWLAVWVTNSYLDLSWGTTLLAVIEALTPQNLPDLRVVQMLGGLGRLESETYGADLTLRMAQTLGARARLLPSPGIVTSKLVRDALLQDGNIAATLELAARADLAVVGIGAPQTGAVVLQAGILTEAELHELHSLGAVGDIALRFFDSEGRAVEHPINDRIIGLDLKPDQADTACHWSHRRQGEVRGRPWRCARSFDQRVDHR